MSVDSCLQGLQVYVVGGAVRDALLGLSPGDRDWVVVGSTPEDMVRRGFIPVGGDFPVFLHPRTKEEYALARTERKSGRGYKGFTFYTGIDVTLEQDLARRDLTVNAIAQSSSGELVDPLGGVRDLQQKVFRHVGEAFEEDPVRILRLARFATRFVEFTIAPETLALCRRMVQSGEVDALVPERVWQELSRGLMGAQPSRMLDVLVEVSAAPRVLPGWVDSPRIRDALDQAARSSLPLPARFALFGLDTTDLDPLCKALRVPTECADAARLLSVVLEGTAAEWTAENVFSLIERCDGLRKPDRLRMLFQTAQLIVPLPIERWEAALQIVLNVDAGAAAQSAPSPAMIRETVRQARLAALEGF